MNELDRIRKRLAEKKLKINEVRKKNSINSAWLVEYIRIDLHVNALEYIFFCYKLTSFHQLKMHSNSIFSVEWFCKCVVMYSCKWCDQ